MPHKDSIQRDIESGLNDLRSVGPKKPVGYLPVNMLTTYFGSSISEWFQFATKHRLNVMLTGRDSQGRVPFLYLYHRDALQALLTQKIDVLQAAGWPSHPEEFIKRMNIEDAKLGTPLYDLIADAFGDKDNPCRSDRQ